MQDLSERILRKLHTYSDHQMFYLTTKSINELYASLNYNNLKLKNSSIELIVQTIPWPSSTPET